MGSENSGSWTVLKLVNWTTEHFTRNQLESPRLCAEILLSHVLKCQRIELYTRFDYLPAADQLAAYRDLVKRAGGHEPVAYLVGYKEFYSLRFKVTSDVLVPRPETEILVSEAVGHFKTLGRCGLAWDVCTGSGCIAVALASQIKDVRVLATDISPQAVAVAAENAAQLNVSDRVSCRVADLLAVPADCPDWQGVDVITANPPYIAENDPVSPEVQHEPKLALRGGADGLDVIRRVIADAYFRLVPGGMLAMEFGYTQADAVRELIVQAGFSEPRIIRDHQDIERSAVAKKKP